MITALKHLIAVKCLQPLINNHTKYRQCDQKLSHHNSNMYCCLGCYYSITAVQTCETQVNS